MQQNKKLIVIVSVVCAILVLGALLFEFVYQSRYRKTPVLQSNSPDGIHSLTVHMIGDPVFPFGPTRCRAELAKGRRIITRHSFDVLNDGKTVDETNFCVTWQDGCVTLEVSGEEMETVTYSLPFAGTSSRR